MKPKQQPVKINIPVLATLSLPGRRWMFANKLGNDLQLVNDKGEKVTFYDYFVRRVKRK